MKNNVKTLNMMLDGSKIILTLLIEGRIVCLPMKKKGWEEAQTQEFFQTIAENITDWGKVDPYVLKNV